ncbi:protein MpABCC2 [Marchantia polymorpha subsp. ruderalis]
MDWRRIFIDNSSTQTWDRLQNCSIDQLGFKDLAYAAFSLNLCYQSLLVSALSCFVALILGIQSSFDSGRERKKIGFSWSALCLSRALLILYGLLLLLTLWKWWRTSWNFFPIHEIVFYGSQVLFWTVFPISIQKTPHFLVSTQLSLWWVVLAVLTSLELAAGLVKGSLDEFSYSFDVALLCVPLVSSLYFCVKSFTYRHSRCEATEVEKPLLDDEAGAEDSAAPQQQHQTGGITRAGLFSRLTFTWLNALLTAGSQKPLDLRDLPALDRADECEVNWEAFRRAWEAERAEAQLPSLGRALWTTFRGPFCCSVLLSLLWSGALFSGPVLQNLLIDFMYDDERSVRRGLALVGSLFAGKLVEALSKQQFNFQARRLGLRMWAAVGSAVYRKTLRLSQQARQERSVGEISNMLSSDVQRLLEVVWYLGQGIAVPFQLTVAVTVLFYVVGVSTLAGLAVIAVVLALNMAAIRQMRRQRVGMLRAKDRRMQVTAECLGNMKLVKLQAWDAMFRDRITRAREVEKSRLQNFSYLVALGVFLTWTGPLAVSAAIFLVMVLLGQPLTTAKVFTALTTIRILQEPVRFMPDVFSNVLQAVVSLQRIRVFLCEDEIDDDAVDVVPADHAAALAMDGASFVWGHRDSQSLPGARRACPPAISNLCLTIRTGDCVAVCGAVGSGKSTLLYSMLGELPRTAGVARRFGRCAYVSQTAWIQNSSVRENIVFGRDFDSERYGEALRVSGLEPDLAQLPHGDATEIGEKGINLSGGQKQRIQLARAVYEDADLYFLDDPLSAVDAHTGAFLFRECILGALKRKTVIIVTHQVEFLPSTDLIIVMKDGEIVQRGSYHELVEDGKYFSTFVEALRDSLASVTHADISGTQDESEPDAGKVLNPESKSSPREEMATSTHGSKLIQDEERARGRIRSELIWMFVTKIYYGAVFWLVLVLQAASAVCQLASDIWLAWGIAHGMGTSLSLVKMYVLLVVSCAAAVIFRACLTVQTGVWTAQAFFTEMLDSIIKAPMSFIDSTPLGRILSRSSTDQTVLDFELPARLSQATNSTILAVILLGLTIFVTPQIGGIILLLVWVFVKFQVYYIASARELSRLSAINEAPVFLHLNETISGAVSIRAFQVQSRFKRTNSKLVCNYQLAYFHNLTATSWLGFRLQFIGALVLCCTALAIIFLPKESVSPGMAAIAISYGLSFSNILQGVVSAYSSVENNMVALERISQYSKIKSEAPAIIPARRPPRNWPNAGHIELQNLQIRYRPDMPLVLKGVSCVIRAREKVGVVGRTGSGKSTLVQALFRLVEPAGGRIVIDGVDTTTIGLYDLRSRLSVIPQEPMLFEGTIRSNLDPFDSYTDQQLWEALEKCALATAVRAKPDTLNASVSEQGENWSSGERQLLCLGRVLLKNARILVLDEATASVDISTDAIIRTTIQQNFADCTIISVAHRIPTVITSDRVLVVDDGYMVENDSPEMLLARENSLFAKLVQEYRSRKYVF